MKLSGFIIIVLIVFWSAAFFVSADPAKIVPFVSLKHKYSDNINFSSNNEEEDFITIVSGGLAVNQKTEVIDVEFKAWLDNSFYLDRTDLDSLDMFFSGNVHYRATERLGVGYKVHYSEDSRQDQEVDLTGLLVLGDKVTKGFSFSSDYLFSETTKGDITLGHGVNEIKETNGIENNDDFRVDISFSRNLSKILKNTTGLLNFNYLRSTTDIEIIETGIIYNTNMFQEYTSDIFQFSTGVSQDITELYNVYVLLGGSYSRTTENSRARYTWTGTGALLGETISPEQEDNTWGGVLATGLNYKGLYYDMGLSFSRDMQGATGTNGAVQRSSVAGNIDRRLTEKFTLTLDASIYLNENKRKNEADTKELTFNIQPGFRYEFSHNFFISCFYKFTSVEDIQNNNTREQNMVYIVVKKEFEL